MTKAADLMLVFTKSHRLAWQLSPKVPHKHIIIEVVGENEHISQFRKYKILILSASNTGPRVINNNFTHKVYLLIRSVITAKVINVELNSRTWA